MPYTARYEKRSEVLTSSEVSMDFTPRRVPSIGYIIGGNIGVILGLYRDNGKGNGNYYLGFRVY